MTLTRSKRRDEGAFKMFIDQEKPEKSVAPHANGVVKLAGRNELVFRQHSAAL